MIDDLMRFELEERLRFRLADLGLAGPPSPQGIDERLAELLASSRALAFGGRKRIRPILLLEVHRAFAEVSQLPAPVGWQAILDAAAAVEMLHIFTLVHDDVADDAPTRLGAPSLHCSAAAHGDGKALATVLGDLIYTRAIQTLTRMDAPWSLVHRALMMFLDAAASTGRGQLVDLLSATAHTGACGCQERAALEAAAGAKTAPHSFWLPMGIGAVLAGAPEEALVAMAPVACQLGIAYQLANDLADYDGGSGGDAPWQDVRAGRWTLLTAIACQGLEPGRRAAFRALLADHTQIGPDRELFLRCLVASTGAPEQVRRRIEELEASARTLAEGTPLEGVLEARSVQGVCPALRVPWFTV